jgi:hypothetical protein
MNKRGEEHLYFLAIEIILGIIIAGIFINLALNFDSVSNSNALYLKNDIKVLSETLLSSPGEITYTYPLKQTFSVSVTDGSVEVSNSANLIPRFGDYNLVFTKSSKGLEVKSD